MSSINSRAKGASGEREFCRWLQKNLGLDFLPERNLEQVRSGGSDILGVWPFSFEVKRVEGLNLQGAWIQAKSDAAKMHDGSEPVVAYRKNRQPWRFLIGARHIGLNLGYLQLEEKTFIEWALKFMKENEINQ